MGEQRKKGELCRMHTNGGDESTERSSVRVNSRRLRTLQEEVYKDEKLVSYLMQKERGDKYDFNQLRTEP